MSLTLGYFKRRTGDAARALERCGQHIAKLPEATRLIFREQLGS